METGNNWLMLVLCALIGYLLGNVQFAVIISRLKYKDDIRNHGSGNAGSTNMLRVFGLKPGLVTFVGDFLKGVAGVLIGRLLFGETGGYVTALFVVIGHDFPAFLGFKGGKGVAATFGAVWIINPWYGLVITVVAAVTLLIFKTISIVSLAGASAGILTALVIDGGDLLRVIVIFILWALIVLRHLENIQRIVKGQESKLSIGKSAKEKKQEG